MFLSSNRTPVTTIEILPIDFSHLSNPYSVQITVKSNWIAVNKQGGEKCNSETCGPDTFR